MNLDEIMLVNTRATLKFHQVLVPTPNLSSCLANLLSEFNLSISPIFPFSIAFLNTESDGVMSSRCTGNGYPSFPPANNIGGSLIPVMAGIMDRRMNMMLMEFK